MNTYLTRPKRVPAFTLAEALLVMAIIGILMLIALPQFMPLIARAKSQEAQIQLKFISNLQTQYRYIHSTYSLEFDEIDFEMPRTVREGGTANYTYEILEAGPSSFRARAEAVVDFDGDGTLNIWEIDQEGTPRETVKD